MKGRGIDPVVGVETCGVDVPEEGMDVLFSGAGLDHVEAGGADARRSGVSPLVEG